METSTPTDITEVDKRSIRDLVLQAHNAQTDARKLPTLHADGVVIVNVVGRRLLGRTSFEDAMAVALASPLKDITTTVDIVDIRLVAPDTAIVSCIKTIHDGRSASESALVPSSTGALTYVLIRSGNSWQIAVAQTTPILA
ncbi:SgcJ/EcaC family oxidoreductase [Glaciibacter sp. 2TAF33]|uniref:SgcJ/EcaC family oxidoreductase n=1 Tax=Glaciibacter sp. 2TAF33 TaxID=3233015 RepID=UPI003F8E7944